ncbi:hypothetical protein OHT76_29870 [Streptomyces sp. NBC_00287]|uniref:hypothetical protein n=1 Tax=Streptomyces sp. NBC_00287 TaxID=2975702 RepID=UPI002E2DF596|nr:hypothetical protein [Streptomyces sp. NBC_00287]
MGCDIHGRVECRSGHGARDYDEDDWDCAIDLELLYHGRNYASFGCLFGVRNGWDCPPLAAGRGLPEDASTPTRRAFDDPDWHSPSWIGWDELQRADWDVKASGEDPPTRREVVLEDERWAPVWEVMRTLAGLYGDDHVRLVVWFDN